MIQVFEYIHFFSIYSSLPSRCGGFDLVLSYMLTYLFLISTFFSHNRYSLTPELNKILVHRIEGFVRGTWCIF